CSARVCGGAWARRRLRAPGARGASRRGRAGGGLSLSDLGAEGWGLLIAAPVIGSFIGVLIRRLPNGQPILWSRSKCDGCGAALTARDLVPIISWMLARGRCRRCGRRLGWFYPAVEIAA